MKGALIAIGLLIALPALAEEPPPFSFGTRPGYSLLGGVTGGGSVGSDGGGGYAGLELSFNRLEQGIWVGGFADATWDFARDALLVCVGPQFGYMVLGLDGGGAARLRDGAFDYGAQGRLLIATGPFALYGRYAWFPEGETHMVQIGLTIKLPLWASDMQGG
ncbi:MAG: hypothetical protein KC620_08885 [Myxococcales bacterium]|nr:hypothetical protein [Myxococcales bacterium]